MKEQTRQNKIIDQQLKKEKDVYGNTHRLLLLGKHIVICIVINQVGTYEENTGIISYQVCIMSVYT